jgi:guanylate kinase
MNGSLFIVSGPSGVGKTTLVTRFLEEKGDAYNVKRCVAFTTRNSRAGEVDGEDYHFISQEEFDRKVDEGFFLEWSDQYIYKYGTPRYILDDLEKGQSYILIIDRVGAQKIVKQCPNMSIVTVLIAVSSVDILKERLESRDSEDKEARDARLKVSFNEIKQEKSEKLYQFTLLNDDLEISLKGLNALFKQVFSNLKKIIEKM